MQLRDGMKSGCFRRESMMLMMYEGEGKGERASIIHNIVVIDRWEGL